MSDLPKCRNCLKKFSSFPSGSPDHFPLLLRCGHTFCKRCITKWASGRKKVIVCPICELETRCQDGKESVLRLWPNVYMAGIMICGSELPSLSKYFANSDYVTRIKNPTGNKKRGIKCTECVSVPAACRCVQCLADMCEKCFVSVHSHSRLLQQHQSVPLRTSLINTECEKHHRLLEFFCEDDKSPICPECMITPEHRNHNIIQTVKKYEGLENELKAAQSVACCALQHCTRVKSQVESEIHKIKNAAYQQAELIHQYMLDYIGIIQAHFLGLTKQLHDSAEFCSIELVGFLEDVESKEILIREACDDTDLVLSSDTKSQVVVNPEKLLETLRMASSLPCSLLARKETVRNDSDESFKDISASDAVDFGFTANPGLPEFVRKLGEIEISGEVEYKLVPISENPELLAVARPKNLAKVDSAEKKPATVRQIQEPPAKAQELVHVTFMGSPTNFRVQRWADKSHIEAIDRCLKAFKIRKLSLDDVITTVAIGELCAAFFEPTRAWYRASVVRKIPPESVILQSFSESASSDNDRPNVEAVGPQDVVEVLYVDYGNTGKTMVSCLRRLPDNLKTVPELSIPCKLSNICPAEDQNGWPAPTVSYFSKVISNRPLLMTTIRREKGFRIVDLHRPAADEIDADVPMSIRDALVFLGLAKFEFPIPSTGPTQATLKKFLTSSPLPVNSLVSVTVSYMLGPERFMVQQMDSNKKYLTQLMKKIQAWANKQLTGKDAAAFHESVHYLQIICPKKGMACLARYPDDKQWYRAQISGIGNDRTVDVEFVDYGDSATLNFSHLLKIPEMFTRLPIQAVPCELHGVSPFPGEETFSTVCQKRFAELCSNSELIMEVRGMKNDIYVVDLFDSMDEDPSLVSVTDRLYREGLVRVEKQVQKPWLEATPSVSGNVDCRESAAGDRDSPKSCDEPKLKVNARVTRVVSPDLFYVQTEVQMTELNVMMLKLQKLVEEGCEKLDEADSASRMCGGLCVVKSKMEMRWCRAKMESLNQEKESCNVVLTDFGWVEQFPLAALLRLPEKFASPEPFLTECCLGSVRPAGGSDKWTLGAVDRFKALVGGEECLMEMCDGHAGGNNAIAVDIWISKDPCDGVALTVDNSVKVSSILAMDGLALPVRRPRATPDTSRSVESMEEEASKPEKYSTPQDSPISKKTVANEHLVKPRIGESEVLPLVVDLDVSQEVNDLESGTSVVPFEMDALSSIVGPSTTVKSFDNFSRLPIGEYIPCHVTHVHDHNTVYFRLRAVDCGGETNPIREEITHWNMMMSQVQEVERNYLTVLEEDEFVVGKPCLSQYTGDNLWHRAVILSTEPMPEAVLVQYIDFGTLEQAPIGRLRHIPPSVAEIPVQAFLGRLSNHFISTDGSFNADVLTETANCLYREDLLAKIHEVSEPPPEKSHLKVMYTATFCYMGNDGFLRDVME